MKIIYAIYYIDDFYLFSINSFTLSNHCLHDHFETLLNIDCQCLFRLMKLSTRRLSFGLTKSNEKYDSLPVKKKSLKWFYGAKLQIAVTEKELFRIVSLFVLGLSTFDQINYTQYISCALDIVLYI